MSPRCSRRQLLQGAAALALLARAPLGLALGRSSTAAAPGFVDALLAKMTLQEKAGQLTLYGSAQQTDAAAAANPVSIRPTAEGQLALAREGRLTGIFNGSNVRWHRALQDAAMESRLKVPLLFAADVIHGFTTVFPVPLAEAAAFDPDLARRTARAAAVEASAVGIDWTFAPMVDVGRDQRWGRVVEGAGEDVLLANRLARARVEGFQGEGIDRRDALAACPKHFAAYGAAEAGLDYNTVDVSERTLREVYFPPFKAGFDAGAPTTMAAFNEISGIPATANRWLFEDVLRGEWDFRGVVVSDFTGDLELVLHGFAVDERDAVRLAITAGVDISMQSGLYQRYLPGLVEDGTVPMAVVDASVRRVLAFKAALGLFDDPYRRLDVGRAEPAQRRPATLALARECARRSVVMLRNENATLPLRRSGQRIALIGPMAGNTTEIHGPWTLFGGDDSDKDLATALRARMADPSLLDVVEGCGFDRTLTGGVRAAVAAAARADVAVLAVGEPLAWSGEAQSRTDIVVPEVQQGLVAAVAATGTPLVVVLSSGRALALDGAIADAQALLVAWFLGSEHGPALAELLFGEHSPSGRLPVSFPVESGQQPFHYAHKPTGRPDPRPDALTSFKARFRTTANRAKFAFGHGLTYGDVAYEAIDVGDGRLAADGALVVRARLRNRGTRAAEETAQLYVRDRAASVTRPVRELKDFRRVALAPGAVQTVEFTLRRDDLLFVGQALRPTVEPGEFDLWVAPSADADGVQGRFELLG